MYEEFLDEIYSVEMENSESHFIMSESVSQQNLIIRLYSQESLTIYQATYLVIERECSTYQQAMQLYKELNCYNHPFRGQAQCLLCKQSESQHMITSTDHTTEFLNSSAGQQLLDIIQKMKTCTVCYSHTPQQKMVYIRNQCHDICISCFRHYISIQVGQGQCDFPCPHCQMPLSEETIQHYTNQRIFKKYKKFQKNQEILRNPKCCWCPNPGCEEIVQFGSNKIEKCKECQTEICVDCKNRIHPNISCQDNVQIQLSEWQVNRDTQQCPKCKFLVEKSSGCNHMTCQYCRHEWCWICGSDYTPIHFAIFNPFGCPALMPGFVRSKDWSYTKLMLWRLMFFILMIIVTPIVIVVFAPIFCIVKITQTNYFDRQDLGVKIILSLLALLGGILLIPITIAIFVVAFLPSVVGIIWFYYEEKKRLHLRHLQAMQRHHEEEEEHV